MGKYKKREYLPLLESLYLTVAQLNHKVRLPMVSEDQMLSFSFFEVFSIEKYLEYNKFLTAEQLNLLRQEIYREGKGPDDPQFYHTLLQIIACVKLKPQIYMPECTGEEEFLLIDLEQTAAWQYLVLNRWLTEERALYWTKQVENNLPSFGNKFRP